MSCSVSVRLEENIKKRLDEIAKVQDRTPHALMKKAIERFIQQENAEHEWFKSRVRAMEEDKAKGNLVPIEKALEMLRSE